MKTKFLLSILFLFRLNAFSQFILAGVHGANDYYYHFNPDTSVYAIDGLIYYSDQKNLFIDINGDGINDFELSAGYNNEGHWGENLESWITPLNNNYVAISHIDSCYDAYYSVFDYFFAMAKSFSINDTINKNMNWVDTFAYLANYFGMAYYTNCYEDTSFISVEKYVGVKVLIPGDTLYGWIEVKTAKDDSMVVQAFACNKISTGIATYQNKSSLEIYPNPLTSSSILQLNTQTNNAEVVIYDVLGKEMRRRTISGSSMVIEKGALASGVYFVRVMSEERQWVEKLIIE